MEVFGETLFLVKDWLKRLLIPGSLKFPSGRWELLSMEIFQESISLVHGRTDVAGHFLLPWLNYTSRRIVINKRTDLVPDKTTGLNPILSTISLSLFIHKDRFVEESLDSRTEEKEIHFKFRLQNREGVYTLTPWKEVDLSIM